MFPGNKFDIGINQNLLYPAGFKCNYGTLKQKITCVQFIE